MQAIIICYIGNLMAGLIKLDGIRRKFRLANVPFEYKKYFQEEWIMILVGLLFPVVIYFVWDELSTNIERVSKYQMLAFFTLGAASTWLPLKWFGASEKLINKVIDEKTNISDAQKPSEEVVAGIKK